MRYVKKNELSVSQSFCFAYATARKLAVHPLYNHTLEKRGCHNLQFLTMLWHPYQRRSLEF